MRFFFFFLEHLKRDQDQFFSKPTKGVVSSLSEKYFLNHWFLKSYLNTDARRFFFFFPKFSRFKSESHTVEFIGNPFDSIGAESNT